MKKVTIFAFAAFCAALLATQTVHANCGDAGCPKGGDAKACAEKAANCDKAAKCAKVADCKKDAAASTCSAKAADCDKAKKSACSKAAAGCSAPKSE